MSSLFLNAFGQDYNFRNYNVEDGLAQSEVNAICEDSLGSIWIGTNAGVCKFDGFEFITYTVDNELPSNEINVLYRDKKNNVWIGTNNGIAIHDGYSITQLLDFSDKGINYFSEGKEGMWIGTDSGLLLSKKGVRIEKQELKRFEKDRITGLQIDISGSLWFVVNRTVLYKFAAGKLSREYQAEEYELASFYIGNNNDIYLGLEQDLLYKGNSGMWQTLLFDSTSITNSNTFVYANNTAWCLTGDNGAYSLKRGKVIDRMSEKNGLASNQIYAGFVDSKNNIWFGFNGAGTSVFLGKRFYHYTENQGLKNAQVFAVLEDKKKNIWVGTLGGGLHKITKDKLVHLEKTKDFDNDYIMSLYEDDSTILFSTFGDGIWQIIDDKIEHFPNDLSPINYGRVISIQKDSKGRYWFGTRGDGVLMYDGETVISYSEKNGLYSNIVNNIIEVDDHIMFATEKGVNILEEDSIKPFHFEGVSISNIMTDKHKNIWYTGSGGVFRYNGESYKSYDKNDGLKSTLIYQSVFYNDDLILGSEKGINRISFNEQEAIEAILFFGQYQGFDGVETNLNAIDITKRGDLLFGTVGGLTVYSPKFDTNTTVPPCYINNIKLFHQEVNWSEYGETTKWNKLPKNLVLSHTENHIQFSFSAINQTYPKEILYSYKLEGIDEVWSPGEKTTTASYTNLPPGKFTFKVKAFNINNNWESDVASFTFEIVPPFYRTTLFYVIVIVSFLGLFYFIMRIRTKALKRSESKLKEEVAKRTIQLQEQNEEIQTKNKDIVDSIEYARKLQESLLPEKDVLSNVFEDSFIYYRPKDIVSGDFYWVEKKGNTTYFSVADCTGHGVPGAMVSVVGTNALNRCLFEFDISTPKGIMEKLSELIEGAFSSGTSRVKDGMDMVLCSIENSETPVLKYSGANNPIWIIRNKEFTIENHLLDKVRTYNFKDLHLVELRPNRQPVGTHPKKVPFDEIEFQLQKGDVIYLFTDGYADQFGGEKGKKFKYKRLMNVLANTNNSTFVKQKDHLETAFVNWKGDLEQVDDVCIIGIKI